VIVSLGVYPMLKVIFMDYLGNGNDRLNVVFLDLQPMAEAGTPQEGGGAPLSLLGPLWAAPDHRRSSLLGVPGLHSLVFDVPGQLPALPDLELKKEKMKYLNKTTLSHTPNTVYGVRSPKFIWSPCAHCSHVRPRNSPPPHLPPAFGLV
jgi:hypothetical protein